MISAPYMPDAFPWMAKLGADRERDQSAGLPIQNHLDSRGYDECLARWEDDGGRHFKLSPLYVSASVKKHASRCAA